MSNKLQRINADIARILSGLLREIKDPRVRQGMLTVVAVDTTGDLRYSKVYLSVLGAHNAKELLRGLQSASGYLRRELGQALSARYTPELIFKLDDSIEHGAHISKVLQSFEEKSDETNDTSDSR